MTYIEFINIKIYILIQSYLKSYRDVVAYVLYSNIVVRKIELQLCYYVHLFKTKNDVKGKIPLSLPSKCQILPLLFFYKDGLGIN